MHTILKSVNFESSPSVQVGKKKTTPSPSADASGTARHGESDGVVPVPQAPDPEDILAEAQKQVELMLTQASSQVAVWQQEAQQTGWQAGYDAGHKAALDELAGTFAVARDIAHSATDAGEKLLRESRAELGKLALAIAEKIIGRELTINPTTIGDIVTAVVEAAAVREACLIRVNPQDHEILRPHWSELTAGQHPDRSWDLVPDRHVARGGCMIEVNGGSIDARLETRLRQVELAFEGVGR